jgi:rhodanese-related sulfurtransferase
MSTIPTTTVTELPDDAVIVDVREADEWAAGPSTSR